MIDWARLEELRDDVGADALLEVIAVFLEEVDEVMARMPSPATPEEDLDPAKTAADVHFLKGVAANLGLSLLHALCHDAELRATARKPGLAALLTAIHDTYAATRARLVAELPAWLDAA